MAHEFVLPDIGEGLTEVEIVEWLVEVGNPVGRDAPLVEVETDKAVTEIPSPTAGMLLHRGAEAGERLEVGKILAVIGEAGESWSPSPSPSPSPSRPEPAPIVGTLPEAPAASPTPVALPAVRKLAAELGVDLTAIAGTGPGGRITREDVEDAGGAGPRERIRLSPTRRAIAARMARSWTEIPHVTTYAAADAANLLQARQALFESTGGPMPLEALFVKAVLPLLDRHPEFNAVFSDDEMVLKRYYNVGVATDTPDGLMLPVVKDADRLTLEELADRIVRLAKSAKGRELQPQDLSDPTFTISNIGAVGGGYGTPLIPYGTSAILSVGRAEEQAVVRDGRVKAVLRLPLSLSYDHRLIDGALGRVFLGAVVERLEAAAFGEP